MVLEKFSLENRVAIVTGSGRGVGKSIALAFAEAGADVVVTARTESEIEKTAQEIIRRDGAMVCQLTLGIQNLVLTRELCSMTMCLFHGNESSCVGNMILQLFCSGGSVTSTEHPMGGVGWAGVTSFRVLRPTLPSIMVSEKIE